MAEFDFADLDKRMTGALENFKRELNGLRTGRASVSLLDPVNVEAYGAQMPLNQVATVSVPEPRMLSVQVWDKTMVSPVEKAIMQAGLGLNPVVDGQLVRIPLPDLSEERRKELVRIAGRYCEQSKVAVRNIRRDGMETLKTLEKEGVLSKDEQHAESENVQMLTDGFIKRLEETLGTKENEIMQV